VSVINVKGTILLVGFVTYLLIKSKMALCSIAGIVVTEFLNKLHVHRYLCNTSDRTILISTGGGHSDTTRTKSVSSLFAPLVLQ
jgi:hypothetical protein